MDTTVENMVLLNIEDYNELKAKADITNEQIKEEAAKMIKPEFVTLKISFDTYGIMYKPYACVDIERQYYKAETVNDILDKASADIMMWCDKNMKEYGKQLKRSRSTKRDCEGLKKYVANLEKRILKHALANVVLSILSTATIIALFTLILIR